MNLSNCAFKLSNDRQIILKRHNISVRETFLINYTGQLIFVDTNILFQGLF